MTWFLAESFVALLIGVAIVWWTMAPQRKRRGDARKDAPPDGHRH
jgi:hypothetical protein